MTRINMPMDALALVSLLCSFSSVDAFAISGRSSRTPFAFVSTAPRSRPPKRVAALAARNGLFATDLYVTGLSQVLAAEEPSGDNTVEYLDAMEARLDYLATQLSDLTNKAIEISVLDDHNSMSQIAQQTTQGLDAAVASNVAAGGIAGGTAVGAGFMSQTQPSPVDDQAVTNLAGHHVATVAATSGGVAATTQLVDNPFVDTVVPTPPPQVVVESTTASQAAVESFANSQPPPLDADVPANMMNQVFEQASQVEAPPSVVDNNLFVEAMESLQEVAQNAADSFANQLDIAGLSYGSVAAEAAKPIANDVANVVATKTAAVASAVAASTPAAPSAVAAVTVAPVDTSALMDSISSRFSGGFSEGMTTTFNEIGSRLAAASASFGQATVNEASKLASTVAENVVSTEKQLVAQAASQIQAAGDNNLVEIGSAIMGGLAKMGKILMTLLNLILESVFDTSIPNIVMDAQRTSQGLVDGAMDAVTRTLSEIGSLSIADAAVSFANLMLLVGQVLFKLLNGIVAIITGSGVSEWAQIAAATMSAEAGKLGEAAMAYTHQLSEMSVSQLVAVIESFANSAGNTMVTIVGTALDTM